MTDQLTTLRAGSMTATINALGAELHSFKPHGDREWLWQGDPAWWTGRSPLLFPVVGRSPNGRARWRGAEFAMPPHGVARQSRFRVTESTASAARFELVDDATTRVHFPFAFRLTVAYAATPTSLSMIARVENTSRDAPMPACLGFHPGFAWPLVPGHAKTAHVVRFERDEPAPIRRIDTTGLARPQGLRSPVRGRVLELADSLFVDDAVIFDTLASRRLWFGVPGEPGLRVEFPDCPHLGIWMKPGAPYLCLEPWQGFAPDIGDDGDLARRPGVVLVPPVGSFSRTLVLAPDVVPV